MKIIDNIYRVPNVIANSYVIVEPGGLTIIDTGLPYSEKRILEFIASLGCSAGDVRQILITHADLDHYGCLAALQKATGARTYASRVEAEAIAVGKSSRPVSRSITRFQHFVIWMIGKLLRAAPCQVEEIVAEGQVLPVLEGLQVVETPGHAPGHLSYFLPATGVMFCGDSMRADGRGLRGSNSRNNWNQAMADASVRKLAGLHPRVLCPGHGPAILDVDGRIRV